jgi:hypothetical protein
MGLRVTFVSGPRRSGKSAVIRMMLDRLWDPAPHYIRLMRIGGDKARPKPPTKAPTNCGVASARWLEYTSDQVFEVLPAALTSIYHHDPYAAVAIEADADPVLRCAYEYDHRVFVMPEPHDVHEVFRTPEQAAAEMHDILQDTASFAQEMFGLLHEVDMEDPAGAEDRSDMTASTMRGFLYSPLGDELATRIQLQPPYHGLVESDVIIVNTAVAENGKPGSEACLRRIERLLERMRVITGHQATLFRGDPLATRTGSGRRLLKTLRRLTASTM